LDPLRQKFDGFFGGDACFDGAANALQRVKNTTGLGVIPEVNAHVAKIRISLSQADKLSPQFGRQLGYIIVPDARPNFVFMRIW
jgi:hypothetical protein